MRDTAAPSADQFQIHPRRREQGQLSLMPEGVVEPPVRKADNALQQIPAATAPRSAPISAKPPSAAAKPAAEGLVRDIRFRVGSNVIHARYGRGTVVRREGEGEQAKVIVSFPGHGLKKLIERFAGLKVAK